MASSAATTDSPRTIKTLVAGAGLGLTAAARLGLLRPPASNEPMVGDADTPDAVGRDSEVESHNPHDSDDHSRSESSRSDGDEPGQPTQIGRSGWLEVARRVKTEMKNDNVALLAAGVAFYALLAIAPALVATISVYGLVADPGDVRRQVTDLMAAAPEEARSLVVSQLESVTSSGSTGLGLTAIVGLLSAVWSASAAVKHLIGALNAAYDEDETRGFLALRGLAIAGVVGGIVVFGAMAFVSSVVPTLLEGSPFDTVGTVVRYPLLFIALVGALALLYRYAPDRSEPCWAWTAPGTVLAAVLLVVSSVGFSIYTANFGSYGETYGSIGSVVVVMLWLMICATVVILGAELNAEAERQTAADTTTGGVQPVGERGAEVADNPAAASASTGR